MISGSGAQTRDFTFVRDTARLAVELGKHDELDGAVVNLGSGREVAIRDLVERICRISRYTGEVRTAPPRPGDVLRHCADVSVLRRVLGDGLPESFGAGARRNLGVVPGAPLR